MDEMQLFTNKEFGNVRIIQEGEKVLFCGSDVAKALGYAKPNDAIARHCRATVKRSTPISGKIQDINFIPEGDVYRLITRSKLPSAERFERWVFDEILPTIRKHGAYMTPEIIEKAITSPDFLIKLATQLKEEQQKRLEAEHTVYEMKPKAEFYDCVASSDDTLTMSEVAKTLNLGIGRNNLYALLRAKKILQNDNRPYQEYVDRGYFRCIENHYKLLDGSVKISIKTVAYQKGVDYIRKILQE